MHEAYQGLYSSRVKVLCPRYSPLDAFVLDIMNSPPVPPYALPMLHINMSSSDRYTDQDLPVQLDMTR